MGPILRPNKTKNAIRPRIKTREIKVKLMF
jgi:hypothetical protein